MGEEGANEGTISDRWQRVQYGEIRTATDRLHAWVCVGPTQMAWRGRGGVPLTVSWWLDKADKGSSVSSIVVLVIANATSAKQRRRKREGSLRKIIIWQFTARGLNMLRDITDDGLRLLP